MAEIKIIGLTGGVGAGKSTILNILKNEYNAVILEADSIGRLLSFPGKIIYEEIVEKYGKEILREDGFIDNIKLADIVFSGGGSLEDLNKIVHPRVLEYIEDKIEIERLEAMIRPAELHLIVIETAIMFESNADKFCDEIWYVSVPEAERIKRLMESRGYSEEKCKNIIAKQLSDEEFSTRSTFIIPNENLELTRSVIKNRMKELKNEVGL